MPKFNSHQIKKEKFIYLWHLYVFICMLKIKVNQSTQKQLSRTKKQTETHSPVTVCNIQSVKVTLYLPFVSPAECLTSQTSLRGRQHAETKQICQKTGKATGGNPFSRGNQTNKADSEAVKIVAPTLRIFFSPLIKSFKIYSHGVLYCPHPGSSLHPWYNSSLHG